MGLGTDSKLFGVGSDYAVTGGVGTVQELGSPQRGDGGRPQENYQYLTADGPLAVADEKATWRWRPTSRELPVSYSGWTIGGCRRKAFPMAANKYPR